MKIKILVAVIATATIIFLSCNWFDSGKKNISNPLEGEWKLDSLVVGKDSNVTSFFTIAALKDSGEVKISFTKDSAFTHAGNTIDAVGYSFDQETSLLTVKDSINQTLLFSKLNDSAISLTAADSSVAVMQKK